MSASELKKFQRKQKKAQLKAQAKAQEEKGKYYKHDAYHLTNSIAQICPHFIPIFHMTLWRKQTSETAAGHSAAAAAEWRGEETRREGEVQPKGAARGEWEREMNSIKSG